MQLTLLFIAYKVDNEDDLKYDNDAILGYNRTCQSGVRTLGTCVHVGSVLWYLRYARDEQNIKNPDESLLNATLDAANQGIQNIGFEIINE